MKKTHKISLALSLSLICTNAVALDNIIRPYTSVRASGMGGVKLTTGLYDENFFGNPAQVTQNPKWKIQLIDISSESTSQTTKTASDIISGGDDMMKKIASSAGNNNHGRIQTVFPALYVPNFWGGKNSFALGLIVSSQFDLALRKSFSLDPATYTDIGPAFTFGRSFLRDKLAVGITSHVTYRLASKSGFSLIDYFKGSSVSPLKTGGEGAHVDFDLGTRYVLPWRVSGVEFATGFAVNNIIGGKYNMVNLEIAKTGILPPEQPRSFGFGVSAKKDRMWRFRDTVVAAELSDIGNNKNGSIYRLVHIGAETRFTVLTPRLGINQGYWTAGLGLDLRIFNLDFSTYGEEMGLNPGVLEDRRYALRVAFQI